MKNIFTFLLGGLITTSAFASNITLNFSGNRNYQVMIDGRNVDVNSYSGNTISLNNLQTGQHSIEVYKLKQSRWFGAGNKLVFSSYFNVSPENDLNITVDNRGSVQFSESKCMDYRNNGDYRNGNWKKDRHKHNSDGDEDDRNGGGYGHNNESYGNGDWNNNNTYNRAMNDYDFEHLIQKIRSQWFGKLSTARNSVAGNYFNTFQERQILQLFSSENDKLDLAKLAYKNTVDQQNFRQLYNLFSYRGQSELDEYIRYNR